MMKVYINKIREILNNYLVRILLSLVLTILICLAILFFNSQLNWLSIVDNLISELAGILITIYFVDRIINRYERKRRKNIETKAKWAVNAFVAHSLQQLLTIYGLREKLKVQVRISNGERIDLSQKLNLTLAPELLNTNLNDPENVYIRSFKERLPNISDFSELEKTIEQGNYVLSVFRDDLEPEAFDYLLVCIEELRTINNTHSKLLPPLEIMLNNPKSEEFHVEATLNSYAIIFSDSFSRAITNLYKLYELVKS